MDEVGYIELTNSGLMKAEKVLERHNLLAECLIKIGVSEKLLWKMPAELNMI